MMFTSKRGQSTLEYAIIILVVVAALFAMQTFIKRGYQGKLRSATDDIGEQYSPGHTTGSYTTVTGSTSSETVDATGVATTNISRGMQDRTGSETLPGFVEEDWPN